MLKITQSGTEKEQRWTLCGKLSGPWVSELEAAWALRHVSRRSDIVDLSDVTSIDECGESLLRKMKENGARFVARGVEMKAILTRLRSGTNPSLRRSLAHMYCDCTNERNK